MSEVVTRSLSARCKRGSKKAPIEVRLAEFAFSRHFATLVYYFAINLAPPGASPQADVGALDAFPAPEPTADLRKAGTIDGLVSTRCRSPSASGTSFAASTTRTIPTPAGLRRCSLSSSRWWVAGAQTIRSRRYSSMPVTPSARTCSNNPNRRNI
jgi:hypothetical protein